VAVPAYCYFGAVVAVTSASDVAVRCIPNCAVLPAYLIGPALLALASAASGPWWPLARAGIAMALLAGFYLAFGIAFPAGMGLGDVKWAGAVGLYVSWLAWSVVATATLLAFAAAAVALLLLRLATSLPDRLLLPMAPFMSAGALVNVLVVR